jgi:hypothetical protein
MSGIFRVSISRNLITPNLNRIQADLQKLPSEVHKFFVAATPVDTGNARKKTKLTNNRKIQAQYAYATRLDQGHSRQAPDGMSKPTKQFMQQKIKQILRKR